MSRLRALPVPALALALLAPTAPGQQLTLVPDLIASDLLDPNGDDLVGISVQHGESVGATWIGGIQKTLPPAWKVSHGSPDGSRLYGELDAGPARWEAGTGWTPMPALPALPAADIVLGGTSADGLLLCGSAINNPGQLAWLWTASEGYQVLSPGAHSAQASGVSGDGKHVGGLLRPEFGDTSRAVSWNTDGDVTDVFLPGMEGYDEGSRLIDMSHHGDFAAGRVGFRSFVWQRGQAPVILPGPPSIPDLIMRAWTVSDDGRQVAGDGLFGGGAWLWTADQGTRFVADLIDQLMLGDDQVLNDSWSVSEARADGSALLGTRTTSGGAHSAFLFELPAGGIGLIEDMGQGLAGDYAPVLRGYGSLHGEDPARLALSDATPQNNVFVVSGLTALEAPFKGGVMVPQPDVILNGLTDVSGAWQLDFPWPVGLPAGTEVFVQAWVKDPAAPVGQAASNGLRLVTP